MKPKPLEDMSKEELINLIKEVNGLVGAVDGDTLKHLRKFIQKYNELDWKYQNVKQAVQGLLEEIEELRQNKIEQSEDYHSRDKNFRRICSCECCSMVSAYTNCINLIKKWLHDAVVKNETKTA